MTDQPAEITESTAPKYAPADDEELECSECGWTLTVVDNPVCEMCYDGKEVDMDIHVVDDVLTFANELNQLGDQIRDNRGDRERWWNKARDLAAEMRAWGKANAAA